MDISGLYIPIAIVSIFSYGFIKDKYIESLYGEYWNTLGKIKNDIADGMLSEYENEIKTDCLSYKKFKVANDIFEEYRFLKPEKNEQTTKLKEFTEKYIQEINNIANLYKQNREVIRLKELEHENKKIEKQRKEEARLKEIKEQEYKRLLYEKEQESKRLIYEEEKRKLINLYGDKLYKYKYKKDLTNEELGKRYERYIGYLYEQQNYKVTYHGIIKGVKDGGIDIIASKGKDILIIQCKRYGKNIEIHENTINQFYGVLKFQIDSNPKKNIKGILYTINNNLDKEATEKLKYFNINHVVLEHPINESYPLIKCNIGKDNTRICHFPDVGQYDRIKIEYSKGEFYCETPAEAELKGFRTAYN